MVVCLIQSTHLYRARPRIIIGRYELITMYKKELDVTK